MMSNCFLPEKIKIFGQTNYDMRFTLKLNGYKGKLQVHAIEKFMLFGIELEGRTDIFDGDTSKDNDTKYENDEFEVRTEYLTRINSKSIELRIIFDDVCGGDDIKSGIEIMDITMTVITGFKDFENLRIRKPWEGPSFDFPKNVFDWESLLEDSNTFYQAGNMLIEQASIAQAPKISALPDFPGIQNIVFFPSRSVKIEFIGQLEGGMVADVAKLHLYDGDEEIQLKREWVKWHPHKVEMMFTGDNIKITQTATITRDDQIVCRIDVETDRKNITMKSACNFNGCCAGTAGVFEHDGRSYVLAQNGLKVYLGFSSSAASSADSYTVKSEPLEYSYEAFCHKQTFYLAMAAGMEREAVERNLFEAIDDPESLFVENKKLWDGYFTTTVPAIKSDNYSLMKLYYMICYSHIANCYDIYYEPYMYPYVCPNKTVWKPQWIWNTMWGALSERWLNDFSIAEGGIRNELISNTQMNYQNDLQPLCDYIKKSGFSVNNSNAGNNPAATYPLLDMFKRTGDRDFLKTAFKLMCDHEYNIGLEDHDGDGLPEYWGNIDEYDQSVRWLGLYVDDNDLTHQVDISGEPDGTNEWMYFLSHNNQEKSLFGHTKAILIDFCSHFMLLQKNLAEIADYLGMHDHAEIYRQKAVRTRKALNDRMWSEKEGFYFDYSLKRQEINTRWMISGITPLMAMAATGDQAEKVVGNITDTETSVNWDGKEYKAGKFCWNLYPPCMASILNPFWRPDEASGYGMGQVTPSSGARYTLDALINYGYFEEARYLINKLFEMQTTVNDNSLHLPYTYDSLTGKENQNHMSQQNAIFNDVIFTYVAGIRCRMDNKFEFMPFDILRDFGPVHFGPLKTKNYPLEIDWNGSDYNVTIGEKSYSFPSLTKWVVPIEELEVTEKNKLSFDIAITGIQDEINILELTGEVHDEKITLLRIPVSTGYHHKHVIGIDSLSGYDFRIDFTLSSSSSAKNNMEIVINDLRVDSLNDKIDIRVDENEGIAIKRISGSLKRRDN